MEATVPWRQIRCAKPKQWNGATRSRPISPVNRGEVWWVEFDPRVGSEIRRTRPAVILSNDAANLSVDLIIVTRDNN